MDKINVYKTYNAADMAAIAPHLKGILRSFPDFAIGNTSIEVNNDGTWYASADMSLVQGLPPIIKIKNEQDAFAIAQKWMQKFDEKLSGRALGAHLPSHLFGGDLLPISATPTIKEIYGLKIPAEWKCNFRLQVKPSSSEKAVLVDNAEIRITLSASGMVSRVEYGFLPVKESVNSDREGLQSTEFLSIGYIFLKTQNMISPYYYIVTNKDENN